MIAILDRAKLWAGVSATVALAIRQGQTIRQRYPLVLFVLLAVGSAEAQAPKVVTNAGGDGLAVASLRSDLRFEPNVGQAAADAEFLARGRNYLISLRRGEVRLALPRAGGASEKTNVVQLKLVGADVSSSPGQAQDQLASKSHYFRGNDPRTWLPNVPQFARVRYESVYPGVDLEYHGNGQQLEFTFVLRPGTSPGKIAMAVEGATRLSLDSAGELVVELPDGRLHILRPLVYQEVAGHRRKVDAQYVLERGNRFRFRLADFDPNSPVVIDPVISYSTYLGGSQEDAGLAVTVDSAGNAYVTGSTSSTDFPTAPGALQNSQSTNTDAFVSKFDPAGALVYSTYLGGSGTDIGNSIAVDESGNVYIGGETTSFDLPVTAGALQASNGGSVGFASDGFVASLSPDGSALNSATYLGGNGNDQIFGLALDSSGNVLVSGFTNSTTFPVSEAFQASLRGSHDAFVSKLQPAEQSLIYSTYFGGSTLDSDIEMAHGIAVDSTGAAYIVGRTTSVDLPTLLPVQATLAGGEDSFVAKFDRSGAQVYATYLGGGLRDQGLSIAVDAFGSAYVTGLTTSPDFPVANALQPVHAGGNDIFVTKIDPAGSSLTFSTYLGGSGSDAARGIAVDSAYAYLTGTTTSTDFPTVDAIQGTSGGSQDLFLVQLDLAGTALVTSTYLGGSGNDNPFGIAVGPAGSVYLTGRTLSVNFPIANAMQPALAGNRDAFVVRVATGATDPPTDLSLAASGEPDPVEVDGQIVYSVTVTNHDRADATEVIVSMALPASADFVRASVPCTAPPAGTAGTIACELDSLGDGDVDTIVIVVTPTVAGPLEVLLTVRARQPDGDSTNNSASVTVIVGTLGPAVINISEMIVVADVPGVRPSALLNIAEEIVVQDLPNVLPSAMVAIDEGITVTDVPAPRPSAMLAINESVTVTDLATPLASALLSVIETVTVSDTLQVDVPRTNNTSLGTGVLVRPVDVATGRSPVTMTFANVTRPGESRLEIGNAGPPPPPGFVQGTPSLYYDLTTTADFTGFVQVCVGYTGTTFPTAPALWHHDTGGWVNITTLRDVAKQEVCGNTLSLSPFALFAPTANGRMHGSGHIDRGNRRHHFEFQVSQFGGNEDGQLKYWANGPRQSPPGRFEATAITGVTFSNDPGVLAGRGPADRQLMADSVLFAGSVSWNGQAGYTFEAIATDRGEPGRDRDTFSLIVRDSRGAIVAEVSGALAGGNIQSTRLQR